MQRSSWGEGDQAASRGVVLVSVTTAGMLLVAAAANVVGLPPERSSPRRRLKWHPPRRRLGRAEGSISSPKTAFPCEPRGPHAGRGAAGWRSWVNLTSLGVLPAPRARRRSSGVPWQSCRRIADVYVPQSGAGLTSGRGVVAKLTSALPSAGDAAGQKSQAASGVLLLK